ncbi:MAG: SpoIIE family protein phosphatase [Desulfobacterales bacterium]
MKGSKKCKLQLRILLVLGAVIVVYVCHGLFFDKLNALETRIIDHLFVLRPKVKPADPPFKNSVAHVDANYYFSRPQHAQVIRNLAAMKVSAQFIDFIFEDMISNTEDQPLIDATKDAGNVYFGLTFDSLTKPFKEPNYSPENVDIVYPGFAKWQVVLNGATESFYVGDNPRLPYRRLAASAQGLGFLNLTPDPDGILRRLPLLVQHNGVLYPSLSFRTVCDYLGIGPENIIVKPGRSITLKGVRSVKGSESHDILIPIDKSGRMILHDPGVANQIPHFRYSEIYEASPNSAKRDQLTKALSGKFVVLSETLGKQYKTRLTGDEASLSSGVIHALVLQNILSGSFLRKLSDPTGVFIEIGILSIILLMSMRFSSPVLSVGTLSLAGVYIALAVLFFFYVGVIFQFVRPMLVMLCALSFLLIGMGIENALLFAKTERARKIAERELEIGREIQAGFFPTVLPKLDGWELSTYFQTARHVSGDFYDVFTLGKERNVGIVISDVCDKGVGAALFMALFRSFIRVLSGTAHSDGHLEMNHLDTKPEKILLRTIRSINNYISITHEQAGMFATIFYGILEPQTGELTFINGGHEPPIIIEPGGIKTILKPTGPAVGLYPNLEFKTGSIILAPQDTLLVYTDGVTDAQNKAGVAFSKKRLLNIAENSFATAEDLISKIKIRVNEHIADENQFDDITLMALRREI